jgi:hypothetical protein
MSRSINLANATNSLTDTSARHHKVGRVCVDWYNSLVDPTVVSNAKDDYRAIRFEVALGIGRTFSEMGYSIPDNRGLAPVFTNTAALRGSSTADDLVKWYVKLYNCRTVRVSPPPNASLLLTLFCPEHANQFCLIWARAGEICPCSHWLHRQGHAILAK